MAELIKLTRPYHHRQYFDKSQFSSFQEQEEAKKLSKTIYVGNLSFVTREEQIYNLMSSAGAVDRVIMGLHRVNKTPCGFCFVIFLTREAAEGAASFLTGAILDGQVIKVEIDPGFKEGRQYGRATGGGQVRDELRNYFDPARGGYGKSPEQSAPPGRPFRGSNRKTGVCFAYQRGECQRGDSCRYSHENASHMALSDRGRSGHRSRFHPYSRGDHSYRDRQDTDRRQSNDQDDPRWNRRGNDSEEED